MQQHNPVTELNKYWPVKNAVCA